LRCLPGTILHLYLLKTIARSNSFAYQNMLRTGYQSRMVTAKKDNASVLPLNLLALSSVLKLYKQLNATMKHLDQIVPQYIHDYVWTLYENVSFCHHCCTPLIKTSGYTKVFLFTDNFPDNLYLPLKLYSCGDACSEALYNKLDAMKAVDSYLWEIPLTLGIKHRRVLNARGRYRNSTSSRSCKRCVIQ